MGSLAVPRGTLRGRSPSPPAPFFPASYLSRRNELRAQVCATFLLSKTRLSSTRAHVGLRRFPRPPPPSHTHASPHLTLPPSPPPRTSPFQLLPRMKQPSLVILLTLAASATAYTCQDYGNPDNAMGYDCSSKSVPGVLQFCADCHCQTYNDCREAESIIEPTYTASPTASPPTLCVDDDGWEDSYSYTVSAGFIHSFPRLASSCSALSC